MPITMTLRTLIVDDEPLARRRIRKLLSKHTDIEILGECGNGLEAVEQILAVEPDLVFLDIQMPELDGFEVIRSVAPDALPAIVFVTAYDEHAVRAFEVNALDYLLKPFDEDRFEQTLSRVRQRAADESKNRDDVLKALQAPQQRFSRRLVVKNQDRLTLLNVDEIEWIQASGKIVRIHAGGEEYAMRETLQSFETKLDPERFARIHRSSIVNLDAIQSLEPLFHGEYQVKLKGGAVLTLSRSYRASLSERLGNSF